MCDHIKNVKETVIEAWDKGTEGNYVRRSVSVIIKLIKEEAEKHDEDEDNNNKEDSKKNSKKIVKKMQKMNVSLISMSHSGHKESKRSKFCACASSAILTVRDRLGSLVLAP